MADRQAQIGLSDETIAQVTQILRRLLANEFVLSVKIKQFHWNVRWPHFGEYHQRFDDMAAELQPIIDDTAERIRALGVDSPGTMKEFITEATLEEFPTADTAADKMIGTLLADYETIIQELRADISTCEQHGDAGNADFLTAIMEAHEKTAWMLRATVS